MTILQHFKKSKKNGLVIYRLKSAEWNAFIDKLPDDFRLCYIADDELKDKASKILISESDFLEKYVLPDLPNIKSGDFGELLSFFAVKENFSNKGIMLNAPEKWRWKDNRNKPAPGSDSVFFYISDSKKFSKKDMLISVESKMKAVNPQGHRIQDAIDGATEDKLSRLAKTLIWLEEKYAKEGLIAEIEMIERFKDPATHGNYQKLHKAVAILDDAFEAVEISQPIHNPHGVTVIIFSIKRLHQVYEQTRDKIIKSV